MARRKYLVADLLCGAGGSSTGCARALADLGLEMELVCLNHWPVAIETHKRNHPEARHYCQDISTVRPHLIVPEGYLDLLMASPTCTHHSTARGGKPTSDQQRSDPWHIVTWLTELRVKRVIIENVPEFLGWGPVDPKTGRPIKSRRGEYFKAWTDTMRRLGFELEHRILNAADYGDATTRRRFFLEARSDGRPLNWPVASHMKKPEAASGPQGGLALFPSAKPWRAAREIIDWQQRGKSIFKRPVPLSPKTIDRIMAGALKFNWPVGFILRLVPEIERSLLYVVGSCYARRHQPPKSKKKPATPASRLKHFRKMRKQVAAAIERLRRHRQGDYRAKPGPKTAHPILVTLRNHVTARSPGEPVPAITAGGTHIALAEPVIVRTDMHGRKSPGARGASDPLMTITGAGGIAVAEPFVVKQNFRRDIQGTDAPAPTITTEARVGLVEPVFMNGRKGNEATPVSAAPLPTLDTKGGVWVAEPVVINAAHGNDANENDPNSRRVKSVEDPLGTIHAGGGSFAVAEPILLSNQNSGAPRSVDEPVSTITTGGAGSDNHPGCARPMLVEPFMLSRVGEGAPRGTEEPTPTQVAKHSHILVEPHVSGEPRPMISPYYGTGSGQTCTPTDVPLPTATAQARFGLVVPVTHSQGNNQATSADQPLNTITTAKGGEFALVTPVTHDDASQRARPVSEPLPGLSGASRGDLAFVTASFGEREGQDPRVHSIEEPTPTICATGHVNLAQGIAMGTADYDILFRMLEPHELAAAMGFSTDEAQYEFTGTKTEKIKQIGNAVPVNTACALVKAMMSDAAQPVAEAKPRAKARKAAA